MNDHNTKKDHGRKPYEKPELRIIELAAEEVLAAGCKSYEWGGAFGSPASCIGMNCAGFGS